jgi:hypothetical protein
MFKITDFTKAPASVIFEAGRNSSFEKFPDHLICHWGEYARLWDTPYNGDGYQEGNEAWALVDMLTPPTWGAYFRTAEFDNYPSNPNNTTRIAVAIYKDGTLHLLSNRGDQSHELANGIIKLPNGQRTQIVLHVIFSPVEGIALTQAFVNGALAISTTKPNMDHGSIFQRERVCVDGGGSTTGKSITFFEVYAGPDSPMLTQRQILEAQLAAQQKQLEIDQAAVTKDIQAIALTQYQLDHL